MSEPLGGGLEHRVLGRTGEGDDVADVLHSRHEEDEALEAETEAGVRTSAPAACVDIPSQMGHIHLTTVDLCHELVIAVLTDATTDNLTD